jgi:RNA polymerase sigma-70 factor, ECF subfamily
MTALATPLPPPARPRARTFVSVNAVHASATNLDSLATETTWLIRVRDAQDPSAFDRLFAALGGKVLGYLMRSGGCAQEDGENLLQDIWLTVWTKAHLFDASRASARTWIFALARNAMIDLKRVQSRERQAFEQYLTDNEDSVAVDPNHSVQIDGGRSAALLEHIAPEQAQVLLMAYVEGKSHREIARELGLPTGTVKSRLRLGFTRMRALIEGPLS